VPERRYDVAFYMPWMGPTLEGGGAAQTGGAETQIHLISQALATTGLRVCLVAYETDRGLPRSIGGVDVLTRTPYRGRLVEAGEVFRALRTADADVVVARGAGPVTGLVSIAARILRSHFVFSSASVTDFTLALESKRFNRALYRLGIRLARAIVVQTDEQIALCRAAFDRTAVRIPNVAEPARSTARRAEAFLWVGRLSAYKHPERFIDLARRLPEAHFRLVGVPEIPVAVSQALLDRLEREARPLQNVEILPAMPRAELLSLMERAVAIVNTSDYEGMPNVFLEAWARGVPALSLSQDPDGLIQTHGLGHFAGGSPERLAEQARNLWSSRDDHDALGRRCTEYVERHHAVTAIARQWRRVLRPG
jgi:glycosyltransferase involved in cell wall biosynthesis